MQFFTKDSIKFFKDLSKNNSKEWFDKNRDRYEEFILQPSKNYVMQMGLKLETIAEDIVAVPKIDKSIFRLHRDVRFSKNKAPYKTNLGVFLWEGERKKIENSGFYFHLEPGSFFMGVGLYVFPPDILKQYRKAIDIEANAKELDGIIKKLLKKGDYTLGGKHYKKLPRGVTENNYNSELALFNGLFISYESKNTAEFIEADQLKFLFKKFKDLLPLHNWLMENVL